MKYEVLPSVEDVEKRGPDPARELPDDYELQRELQGAALAAGAEAVHEAVREVVSGQAKPEALMWWIDDLRDPERHEQPASIVDVQEGVVPDFIADTQFAGGAQDVRDPADSVADAQVFTGKEPAEVPDTSDADADYFFSAVRKRRGDPDDESGDDGTPGDDGQDPKDNKSGKKKAAR